MQDSTSPYDASRTMEEFKERTITPIDWSPYSPDFNPEEHAWKIMIDKIRFKYPNLDMGKRQSSDQIRAILKVWNFMNIHGLTILIESMHDRCQAVIDSDGGPTKY